MRVPCIPWHIASCHNTELEEVSRATITAEIHSLCGQNSSDVDGREAEKKEDRTVCCLIWCFCALNFPSVDRCSMPNLPFHTYILYAQIEKIWMPMARRRDRAFTSVWIVFTSHGPWVAACVCVCRFVRVVLCRDLKQDRSQRKVERETPNQTQPASAQSQMTIMIIHMMMIVFRKRPFDAECARTKIVIRSQWPSRRAHTC